MYRNHSSFRERRDGVEKMFHLFAGVQKNRTL